MKKNILILPCSTQLGVEQFNSLKYNKHFNLIGASHNNTDNLFQNFIKLINNNDTPEFIQEVLDIIKLNNIEIGLSYFIKINEFKYFLIKIDTISNDIIKSPNYQFEVYSC